MTLQKWLILFCVGLSLGCSKTEYGLPAASNEFGQQVTYKNKVDLVLMVDNSSSMGLYQDRLAASVPVMINSLNGLGMDYNLVVVTTDMRSNGSGGMFVGSPKVLTKNTPNLVNALTARVRQGTGGSDLERGFESIYNVLSPNYLNGDGRGFLREDALLAIIALSNEDDYSSLSVANFASYLDSVKPKLKGTIPQWVVNFIGVPNLSSSCSTALDGIYKEPGLKWIDLATRSNGRIEPVCDTDLGKAVNNIRQRIVELLTDFRLDMKPEISTIRVFINGTEVPQSSVNGWEYIEAQNLIRFYGSYVPGASDRIVIDYKPKEAR